MLAEDSVVNQEVALNALNWLGCEVVVANDGREALNVFKSEHFEVVLMDCQMPHMSGFEASTLIRKFEQDNKCKSTAIIALTANATDGDREKCIDAGMNDYLSKPFKLDDLYDVLQRWITPKEIKFSINERDDKKIPMNASRIH